MISRTQIALVILLVITTVTLTGCVSCYVDDKLPKVAYSDISQKSNPKPVQLKCEFQVNGAANAQSSKQITQMIKPVMEKTHLFSTVDTSTAGQTDKINIIMNNVGDIGQAMSKGFVTGFTFGVVGSSVTDGYIFTATYQPIDGPAVTKVYQHAIHSTIGLKEHPKGVVIVSLDQASKQVVQDLVLSFLRDLQKEGRL